MAEYVTKRGILQSILTEDERIDSKLPRLAFNNEEQEIICENCGNRRATAFKYNSSAAAGSDAVVFQWAPNVTRLVVRGHYCTDCNWHDIFFSYPVIEGSSRENDPKKVTNVELGSERLESSSDGKDVGQKGDTL